MFWGKKQKSKLKEDLPHSGRNLFEEIKYIHARIDTIKQEMDRCCDMSSAEQSFNSEQIKDLKEKVFNEAVARNAAMERLIDMERKVNLEINILNEKLNYTQEVLLRLKNMLDDINNKSDEQKNEGA